MGTDAQDYDNDGWPDIHVTALAGETFPLFRNDGHGAFVEETQASGLGAADGEAVGLVLGRRRLRQRRLEGHLHGQLARQRSHRRFRSHRVQAAQQPVSQRRRAGTFSDAIGRGRSRRRRRRASRMWRRRLRWRRPARRRRARRSARRPSCGRTTTTPSNNWLIVRLVGTKSNRDGIGAVVSVGNQVRTMTTAMGYASSSHAGLHFGLGASADLGPRRGGVALGNQAGGRGCQG